MRIKRPCTEPIVRIRSCMGTIELVVAADMPDCQAEDRRPRVILPYDETPAPMLRWPGRRILLTARVRVCDLTLRRQRFKAWVAEAGNALLDQIEEARILEIPEE